jgi:hypothetical protein
MTPEQRGEAMSLVDQWSLRPSADMKPGEVAAIGNRMADLLRKLATAYPDRKPVMWMHRNNHGLTTTREPLGPDWIALGELK